MSDESQRALCTVHAYSTAHTASGCSYSLRREAESLALCPSLSWSPAGRVSGVPWPQTCPVRRSSCFLSSRLLESWTRPCSGALLSCCLCSAPSALVGPRYSKYDLTGNHLRRYSDSLFPPSTGLSRAAVILAQIMRSKKSVYEDSN